MGRIVSSSGFAMTLAARARVHALWNLARFANYGPPPVAWGGPAAGRGGRS